MGHNEIREDIQTKIKKRLEALELTQVKDEADEPEDPDSPRRLHVDYDLVKEWIDTALAPTVDDEPSQIDTRILEANYQVNRPTDEMRISEIIRRRRAAKFGRALLLDTLVHDTSIIDSAIEDTI